MSEHSFQRNPADDPQQPGVVPGWFSRDASAQVFAEIQRTDVKGAAVGATAGAALTAVATVLATAPSPGAPAESLLWCACACFVAALFLAVRALRPSLRSDAGQGPPFVNQPDLQTDLPQSSPRRASTAGPGGSEARRLVTLSRIVHRKFLLLRGAADLFCVGLGAAGLAALLARFLG